MKTRSPETVPGLCRGTHFTERGSDQIVEEIWTEGEKRGEHLFGTGLRQRKNINLMKKEFVAAGISRYGEKSVPSIFLGGLRLRLKKGGESRAGGRAKHQVSDGQMDLFGGEEPVSQIKAERGGKASCVYARCSSGKKRDHRTALELLYLGP